MKLIPVESSNVAAIGYSPETREMHVQFKSGATYAHSGVEPLDHAKFVASESKGRHYGETFRNKFGVRKI